MVELSPEYIPGLDGPADSAATADGPADSAATAVSQNSSVQETNFPSKAGKHKTIHAFQKDASTMLQLNKKPDHPPPAAATAPWHKRSNGSLSEGATAATKAKSASPREEGLTSKAGPLAKRMPSRGPPPLSKATRDSVLARAAERATPDALARRESTALLQGEEASAVMGSTPTLQVPVMFDSPHEAVDIFDQDWTQVPGRTKSDADKLETEFKRRDLRNRMIRERLAEGRPVRYVSTGNSMSPLVQGNDACTFLPTQAVTAEHGMHAVQKKASEISVGDIVFCQVQPGERYFAHIVLEVVQPNYYTEAKYYQIGNITGHRNGWCFREQIYGILVDVQVLWDGQYYSRPLPKGIFAQVRELVQKRRWNKAAEKLCEPWRGARNFGSRGDSSRCNSSR